MDESTEAVTVVSINVRKRSINEPQDSLPLLIGVLFSLFTKFCLCDEVSLLIFQGP